MKSDNTVQRNGRIAAWIAAGALVAVLHPADTPADCGNGRLETGEQCDGADFGTATCASAFSVSCGRLYCYLEGGSTPTCRYSSQSCGGICGDACARSPEECDNGSANSDSAPDACRSNCVLPSCGDWVVDTGEQCDDGPANDDDMPDACRTDCTRARCGDGVRDGSEACDLGDVLNNTPGSGCSPTCALAGCGINGVEPGETCDDGNTDNDDSCLGTCVPNVCGDGFINLEVDPATLAIQEACDPSVLDPFDSCRYDCGQRYSLCGNGQIQPGEECDEGAGNSDEPNATCRTDCQFPRCGDGVVDDAAAVSEECDRGPGCGADCRWMP